jgi:hypothetical protein
MRNGTAGIYRQHCNLFSDAREVFPKRLDERTFPYARNAGDPNAHRLIGVRQTTIDDLGGFLGMFGIGAFNQCDGATQRCNVSQYDFVDEVFGRRLQLPELANLSDAFGIDRFWRCNAVSFMKRAGLFLLGKVVDFEK